MFGLRLHLPVEDARPVDGFISLILTDFGRSQARGISLFGPSWAENFGEAYLRLFQSPTQASELTTLDDVVESTFPGYSANQGTYTPSSPPGGTVPVIYAAFTPLQVGPVITTPEKVYGAFLTLDFPGHDLIAAVTFPRPLSISPHLLIPRTMLVT